MDISPKAIEEGRSYIFIIKEFQRVSKEAVKQLDGKDIFFVLPSSDPLVTTVRVLKTLKTESSIRRIYIPKSVENMLAEQKKKQQDEMKAMIEDAYHDFNLALTTPYGMPTSEASIRKKFDKLIHDNDLPEVVFRNLRHTSVTYKLKLNGGDIKTVQGDSGHSRVNMVTDVYSHIIDEDRRKNAELFENAFYERQNLNPHINDSLINNREIENYIPVPRRH